MSRIVMAMSGGVDSSVAAALMVRAGHDVIGVFMRHGEPEMAACTTAAAPAEGQTSLPIVEPRSHRKQGCCSASDADDGRRVADLLGIPFYALNLREDFGRIIDYFVAEYSAARTPNPCIVCNNWLKFGKLFEYADSVGAEYVATGHYAQIQSRDPGGGSHAAGLWRGVDEGKDQSYVLFGIARAFLPRMLLPLGGYRKEEIRRLARQFNLRVADKPDSQEICFVPSGNHAEFVRRRAAALGRDLPDSSGEIVLSDGRVVGRHQGIEGFTIGQRKGLRVALGEPHYVTRIEADTRRVVIGPRQQLARNRLTAAKANWHIQPPAEPLRCHVQIRYNGTAMPATVEPLPGERFQVVFDEPRHGVAPGQAAVCYDGPRLLGGGWIE